MASRNNLKTIVLVLLMVFFMLQMMHVFYRQYNVNTKTDYTDTVGTYQPTKLHKATDNGKRAPSSTLKPKLGHTTYKDNNSQQTKKQKVAERTYNISYEGRNYINDPPFKFDPAFKNPCWFEGGVLRCLPYMYVIGVKKCGTSDLFFRLSLHPDFVKPPFKEAQWFARKRFSHKFEDDGISHYVDMFKTVSSIIQKSAVRKPDRSISNHVQITGEGSPSNLHLNTHWMNIPGNEGLMEPRYVHLDYIQHFTPDVKLVITFRDPIERLYSDYFHEYGSLMAKNQPGPEEFHTIVDNGIKMYNRCFKLRSVRSCVYDPGFYQITKIQIQLGIYYVFWEELMRLFPRENVLVLQNAELRDYEPTMTKVYEFLKLRALTETEMDSVINQEERYSRKTKYTKQGDMFDVTRHMLYEFYEPFNQKMAYLTGDEKFLYKQDARPTNDDITQFT